MIVQITAARGPASSLPKNNQFFRLCRSLHKRKNWLHVGSDRGGPTAAVLMSLIQSCQSYGVEPFAYLRDVLDRVSTHPASRIAELLPDVWKPLPPPLAPSQT
jgi:hypothetical protein